MGLTLKSFIDGIAVPYEYETAIRLDNCHTAIGHIKTLVKKGDTADLRWLRNIWWSQSFVPYRIGTDPPTIDKITGNTEIRQIDCTVDDSDNINYVLHLYIVLDSIEDIIIST